MPRSTWMTLNHSHSQLDHISNFKIDLMLVSTVAQHSRGLPFKPASSPRTELWFPVLPPGWDLRGSVSPVCQARQCSHPLEGKEGWEDVWVTLCHSAPTWKRLAVGGGVHTLLWQLWARRVTAEAEWKKQVVGGSWEGYIKKGWCACIHK